MATFTNSVHKGWKKIKYSQQDGKDHYFYADPKNTDAENKSYKLGQERMWVQRKVSKAVSGGKEHITSEGIHASRIVAEDPDSKRLRESLGTTAPNVTGIIKTLKKRRKREKRKKEDLASR